MNNNKTIKRQHLQCGCCGRDFYTWPGYVDQDQDKGYGICFSCQERIRLDNYWEITKTIRLLADNLNPLNRFKLLYSPREEQEEIAMLAIECGMITFSIGRS